MALVEREAERTVLSALVDRAIARAGGEDAPPAGTSAARGDLVLVQGPPGIGKSSLLQWLAGRAGEAGVGIRIVRGTRLGAGTPFRVARWLLADDVRDDPELVRTGWARRAAPLFDPAGGTSDAGSLIEGLVALVAELTHRSGPVILAVDDAQWADAPSLALLLELAARHREVGAGLALTVTTGTEAAENPDLDRLAALAGPAILTPRPLTRAGVGRLLAESAAPAGDGVAEHIHHASNGNPLIVRAMLEARDRTGDDTPAVPGSVTAFVLTRLTDLAADAQSLALAAAVLGESPLHRAARLAGLAPDAARRAADALAARHVLAPGEPLRFSQPIVGDAVLAGVPPFELAGLHRRAAGLLAADGAESEAIAVHLLPAEPAGDPWTSETLRRAATAALDRGDPVAAAELLRRAVDEPAPAAMRGELLIALARAEAIAGSVTAIDAFRRALAHVSDQADRLDAWHGLSRRLYLRGDYRLAATAAAEGLAELAPGDPAHERLLGDELSAATFVPELAADAANRTAALIAGEPPSHPVLLAQLIVRQGWTADRMDRVAALARSAVAADPLVDPSSGGIGLSFIAGALNWVDEPELARRFLDAGLDRVAAIGDPLAEVSLRACRAWACIYLGDLAAAQRDLDVIGSINRLGWAAGEGLAGPPRIRLALETGDLADARAALLRTPDLHNPGRSWFRGAVAYATGEYEAALEAFVSAGDELSGTLGLRNPAVLPWQSSAALAAHRLGRTAEARSFAAAEVALAEAAAVPRALGDALAVHGLIAGDVAAAERAVAVLERSPSRLSLARALLFLGIGYRRRRRMRDARSPLGRALDLAEQMGAAVIAEQALWELRNAGARPRRRPRSGVQALTPREREVALLAAHGLTTRQISAQLFLTPKTVESHLTHVFRKLRISARAELGPLLGPGDASADALPAPGTAA